MTRKDVLDQAAECVCKDRDNQYNGKSEDNLSIIKMMWNIYLHAKGVPSDFWLSSEDVGIMMALLKIARQATGAGKEDNFVDMAGYASLAGEAWSKNRKYLDEEDNGVGNK